MTASPAAPIRIALGENQVDLATTLALLIDLQPDMVCVGHAASSPGVLALAQQHDPEAYVVDLMLDDGSATPLIRTLRERRPDCAIIVFSGRGDAGLAAQCVEAGCDATLVKDGQVAPLLQALRCAVGGRRAGRNSPGPVTSNPASPDAPGKP